MRLGSSKKFQVGDVIDTRHGKCRIVKWVNSRNITVEFLRAPNYRTITAYTAVARGSVKDLYYPTVEGVGYFGVGPHLSSFDGQRTREYKLWHNMLIRCYRKDRALAHASYVSCTVHPRWHNFQTFCDDIHKMSNWERDDFQLDKDLTIIGNQVYSPKRCAFIPSDLNSVLGTRITDNAGITSRATQSRGTRHDVYFVHNGNKTHLGTFERIEDARAAYREARAHLLLRMARKYRDDLQPRLTANLKKLARALEREVLELRRG